MTALVDELVAPTADSATRRRLTQALVELSGTTAQEILRQLAHELHVDIDGGRQLVAHCPPATAHCPRARAAVGPPTAPGSRSSTARRFP
ncbi:hypothetical protein ACWEWI_07310 [Streptomyces sp. NPDC003753]